MKSGNGLMLCDFCGNSQEVVEVMVRGTDEAAICDECIDLCLEILKERRETKKPSTVIETAKAWAAKAMRKR